VALLLPKLENRNQTAGTVVDLTAAGSGVRPKERSARWADG
jgi:hypothetical protein